MCVCVASMNGESEEPSKVYKRKSFKGVKTNVMMQKESDEWGGSDLMKRKELCDDGVGKFGFLGEENRVTISLVSKSKKEVREYRRKLQGELDLVREWMRRIEEKERDRVDGGGVKKKRVREEVGEGRPLNQLSVSVVENSQGGNGIEGVEKEKRTPKVNQFYQNSEFLLGKDKIPPVDKKSKGSGKKQGGGDLGFGGLGKIKTQFFKTCTGLLEKLMKHKHGWVFNVPVDAKSLGLHDYFDIIKEPMDLGTVKSRLNKNFYDTPIEFTEDVRLTFRNAMTYNPKGQDVYVMAEQLLQIFEEKWAVIEVDYLRELKLVVDREGSLTTPTSKKAHTPQQPPIETKRALERSESITPSTDLNTKLVNLGHPGRPAAPKKPKARDPNKREMTYAEKQKLSANLQSLPPEKLESVVDIIKKRNSSLCQQDDEIEVDINSFDTETLWELDRFLINYKKYLSKNKKNTELANKAKPAVERSNHNKNPAPVVDLVGETKTDKEATLKSSPFKLENRTENTGQASKSSGSSRNSGSTSTDSGSSNSSE